MRVASVCSSVGGLDLGLHRAGHETVFFCEFEPWRRKVLARHWPGVPVHHDLKELDASEIPACDLLVGGTPCQDLSVAGNRAGLDGERSGLFHAFAQLRIDLFDRYGCAWSLWENVAGALSSNKGADFATVLASHVGADVPVPAGGWGGSGVVVGPWGAAEWRLLDARFFGVPQRRRRVFVVGHLGAEHAPQVLADGARRGRDLGASGGQRPQDARAARGGASDAIAFHMTQDPISGPVVPALSKSGLIGVSFAENQRAELVEAPVVPALATPGGKPGQGYSAVRIGEELRKLTPTERERAMGWPDGWTYERGPSLLDAPQGWPTDGKSPVDYFPDGRREQATGDGVVAHVAEWIGLGLAEVA